MEIKPIFDHGDDDVVHRFLKEYSGHTQLAYSRALDHLTLYAKYKHHRDIYHLSRSDLIDYQQFLLSPPKDWVGKRYNKDHPNWRPFSPNRSRSSVSLEMRVLKVFYRWLYELQIIYQDPMDRVKIISSPGRKVVDRYLEIDEVKEVIKILKAEDSFNGRRARYLISLLFYTGLRISEVVNHKMNSFVQREGDWYIRVTGKGNKIREVPCPDAFMTVLKEFREFLGLEPLPNCHEITPLVPNKTQNITVGKRQLDNILKNAFKLCANKLEKEHPNKAEKLRMASAHWLRHSYITYLIHCGADIATAKENAGHSNVQTTMIYTHVLQSERHKISNKLSLE